MAKITRSISDPLIKAFLQYLEEEIKDETKKIVEKYEKQMIADLERVRVRVVAQAGLVLSERMSIEDLGRTVRIEITKPEDKK